MTIPCLRFFIDRPIFAAVLSIVITLAGGISLWSPAGGAVSRHHAADGRGLRLLSRRQRAGRRRHGRRSDRAAGQRRREHDVHVVAVHQRRQLHPDGHVQARRRPEHGPGAGAEPRVAGRADPARPGQAPRRGGEEEVAQHPDDRQRVLAGQHPEQPLPEQLRDDPDPRRAGPARRRRRHHLHRPAELQHAGLARPAEDVVPQPEQLGRGQRDHPAEHPGRRRPARPAAGPRGPGVPVHHHHPGPPDRDRAVRGHDPQDRRPGGRGPHPRRRPRRGRRPGLRPGLHAGRPAHRRAVGLPAPRLQRARDRRAGPREDGGAQGPLPRGGGLLHRLRHHAVHRASRSTRCSTPCATR